MTMVMCLECGEFVTATKDEGNWVPQSDECPNCGGTKFEHNGTDTVIRTDESRSEEPDAEMNG